eukprot:a5553_32.p1 GENE.a5553_32~~a5553_32.p1  ORF type:complete len:718 (+),score=331.00 a5553_32:46-2154(+)
MATGSGSGLGAGAGVGAQTSGQPDGPHASHHDLNSDPLRAHDRQEYHITFPECSKPDFMIEFTIYICFMITFSLVVNNLRDPKYSYLQVSLMDDLLLEEEFHSFEIYRSFKLISKVSDFWEYLTDVFPTQMFTDQGAGSYAPYGVNFLVGSVRMRQVRVKPAQCALHQDFYPQLKNCFAKYAIGQEDQEPYGPKNKWTYRTCSELGTVCQQYARLRRYDGGGFAVYMNGSYATELARIRELQSENWVDLLTRAVFIDWAAYNPSVNMFVVGQMTFEFLPTGGILPDFKFRVVRLYRYNDAPGRLQLVGEVAVLCFVLLFVCEELAQMVISCVRIRRNRHLREAAGMYRYHVPYFRDAWNYVDWLNIIIFLFVFGCRYNVDTKFAAMDLVPQDRNRFYDFTSIVQWDAVEKILLACNAFLLWFKVFKFAVVFVPRMGVIVHVVATAFFPLFFFLFMFMFVLMGFAQAGAIAFGSDVNGFDTIGTSIFTILLAVLGQRDFAALYHSNRVFGPLFFYVFVILVIFIALSMFLTIVDSAYDEVSRSMQRNEEPSLFSKAIAWFSTTKVGARVVEALELQEKLAVLRKEIEKGDLNRDGLVSEAELAELVKTQRDYFEGAAADLMEKYDVDNDKVLSPEEREHMYRDIEAEQMRVAHSMLVLSEAPSDEHKLLFELLSDRVAKIESRVESHIQLIAQAVAARRGQDS